MDSHRKLEVKLESDTLDARNVTSGRKCLEDMLAGCRDTLQDRASNESLAFMDVQLPNFPSGLYRTGESVYRRFERHMETELSAELVRHLDNLGGLTGQLVII